MNLTVRQRHGTRAQKKSPPKRRAVGVVR